MSVVLQSWLGDLAAVVLVVLAAAYVWFSHSFTYWTRRGVPQRQPQFPFGNVRQSVLGQTRFEFVVQDIYNELKGEKYFGMYGFSRPLLVLTDPDLIRLVLVKDFDSFNNRGVPFNDREPLNHNLFFLTGVKWRRLRNKLTPTFTTGKLKMMCQTMQDCGREMLEVLEESAGRGEVLEMREVSARYATDVIASVAFGVECNCQRNPEAEFRQWGRKVFQPSLKNRFSMFMHDFLPTLAKLLRIGGGTEEVSQYFRSMVRETVEHREKNSVTRNDFMHLLIQLKNRGFVDEEKTHAATDQNKEVDNWKLSLDDVAAQAFLFFLAGFETSSTTMSFALYELALNPDVQKRLQEEVDATMKKNNGQLTYEAISEMSYLDKVVAEALRKYPPGAILVRKCNRQYQFPNGGLELDEGIAVIIPTYAMHHDPEYFPEPDRFDPERFSDEQKAKRHPYVYLPFGEGPRNCIGMRLGLLQAKIGLAYLTSKYEVQCCEHTTVPIEFNKVSFIPMPAGGVQLRLAKRA
ncbi:probable cytochrome P450 6a13 isoform X1 [Schistocerca cancellata]|uniref:probable cytochrome P450 6a13 isoform X1 n=1 Tax=Schistocerca cancellata TaxID=274614 RepID=UPI0021181F11|nr:probable cytochrome P450 6a13 isoform X1 [Schistocerca cancellata]